MGQVGRKGKVAWYKTYPCQGFKGGRMSLVRPKDKKQKTLCISAYDEAIRPQVEKRKGAFVGGLYIGGRRWWRWQVG